MAGVDYCTVLPSWEFDKDPACVVSYQFDSIDGSLEANGTDYSPPNNFMDSCLTLECSSNDQLTGDSRESCTLSITSKPQYRVSILGIDIISQSKSLEIYDACEGYMTTSRGKRIPCLDAEGGENQRDVFTCSVRLRETLFGFTVKFPSSSNMKRFNIYNIVLILNPEAGDIDNVDVTSTFSMDKVKSFVDTDTMSPGAQQLMRSVEQFQQNKRSAVSGLQGMIGHSTPGSAGSSGPGMMELMGLMSMFSNMSSPSQSGSQGTPTETTQRGQSSSRGTDTTQLSLSGSRDTPADTTQFSLSGSQDTPADTTQSSRPNSWDTLLSTNHSDSRNNTPFLKNLVPSQQQMRNTITNQVRDANTTVLQTNPLEIITSSLDLTRSRNSVSGSLHQNSGGGQEERGMYQMLQNICGRVSQMRAVHQDGNNGVNGTGHEQLDNQPSRFEGDTGEVEGHRSQSEDLGGQKYAHDALTTVVKSCMEEFELRLQTHIDNRLSQIERKLDAKLDRITKVLQSLTRGSTPSHILTDNHTSTLTHVPWEGATCTHTDNHRNMEIHDRTGDSPNMHTGNNNTPDNNRSEQCVQINTDISEENNGSQPLNSLVMDDESGENS